MRERDGRNRTEEQQARALAQLKRAATAPAIPRELVPVYDALRDLRYELAQDFAWKRDVGPIVDRAEERLDAALLYFRPSKPPQPPGATIPPNQGVGLGEGEKVAQDGSEEAREVEKAPPFIVCRHWRSFEEECPDCEERRPGWPPPGQPKLFTDSDGLQLERKVEDLRRRVDVLEHRVACREVGLDPDKLREEMTREAERAGNLEGRVGSLDVRLSRLEERSRGAREGVGGDSRPVMPRRYICEKHDETYCCPSCESEFFEHIGLDPCPPAPPPSAEPAEETSSGRERCGEGTAGGVKSKHCCLPMAMYRTIFPVPTRVTVKKHPGDPGTDLPTEKFCRWCGRPLREDGELRVGPQGRAETSNPRESGDTLAGGEG